MTSGPYHDGTPGRGQHHYFRAPERPTPAFIHRDHLVIEARDVWASMSSALTACIQRDASTPPQRGRGHGRTSLVFPADFVFSDGTRSTSTAGAPYEPPDRIANGERHHELFRLLRHMKGLGANIERARYVVALYNQNRCDTPLVEGAAFESWFHRAWGLPDLAAPARALRSA